MLWVILKRYLLQICLNNSADSGMGIDLNYKEASIRTSEFYLFNYLFLEELQILIPVLSLKIYLINKEYKCFSRVCPQNWTDARYFFLKNRFFIPSKIFNVRRHFLLRPRRNKYIFKCYWNLWAHKVRNSKLTTDYSPVIMDSVMIL